MPPISGLGSLAWASTGRIAQPLGWVQDLWNPLLAAPFPWTRPGNGSSWAERPQRALLVAGLGPSAPICALPSRSLGHCDLESARLFSTTDICFATHVVVESCRARPCLAIFGTIGPELRKNAAVLLAALLHWVNEGNLLRIHVARRCCR